MVPNENQPRQSITFTLYVTPAILGNYQLRATDRYEYTDPDI